MSEHFKDCRDVGRHIELHRALDELLACWLEEHVNPILRVNGMPPKLFSNTTLTELMEWSARKAGAGTYRCESRESQGGSRMSGLFFDRQGKPIDVEEHGHLLEDPTYSLVARDVIGSATVITVWTGIRAPCFVPGSPPLIFETQAFGAEVEAFHRYATEVEALAGHADAVRRVRESLS